MDAPRARPAGVADRRAVRELLGDVRPLDLAQHYVYVVGAGDLEGVATGIVPTAGEEALLGAVITRRPGDWSTFHALIAGLVERAISLGFDVGVSETANRGVVRHLERTFGLEGRPCGWEPNTGRPVQWRYRVDLRAFLAQLEGVL